MSEYCLTHILRCSSCVCAAARMYQSVALLHSKDITYHMAALGITSQLEIGCGFIAASLPVFPRFFKFVRSTRTFSHFESYIAPLRKRSSNLRSRQPSSGQHRSETQSSRKNQEIVTDVEFHELVLQTGMSSISGNESVNANDGASSTV